MDEKKFAVYLGLGSNLGGKIKNIFTALSLLSRSGCARVDKISGFYQTPSELFSSQPDFINCAALIKTSLSPRELLSSVKMIEESMGRVKTFRYAPRIIDIDILLYNDVIINHDDLNIPHVGLAERLFVLFPLAEIAADATCPVPAGRIKDLLNLRLSKNRMRPPGVGYG